MDAVDRRKEHNRMQRSAASADQVDCVGGSFFSINGSLVSLPSMISGISGEVGGRGGSACGEQPSQHCERGSVVIHLQTGGSARGNTTFHECRVLCVLTVNTWSLHVGEDFELTLDGHIPHIKVGPTGYLCGQPAGRGQVRC